MELPGSAYLYNLSIPAITFDEGNVGNGS